MEEAERNIKTFQELKPWHFSQWLEVMGAPASIKKANKALNEARDEANEAIKENAKIANKAAAALKVLEDAEATAGVENAKAEKALERRNATLKAAQENLRGDQAALKDAQLALNRDTEALAMARKALEEAAAEQLEEASKRTTALDAREKKVERTEAEVAEKLADVEAARRNLANAMTAVGKLA